MKWYNVTVNDAIYYCERVGFICQPFDIFEMEVKEFKHVESGLSFKYRQGTGDGIAFYISPMKNGKEITFEEFESEWKKYVESRKVEKDK